MYLEHLPQSKDSEESTKNNRKRKIVNKYPATIVSNSTMSFENRRLDCVIHAKSYFIIKGNDMR